MCERIKKVMITGASGPLGSMLIRECIRNGVRVLAIVRPDSSKKGNIPVHDLVRIAECDITQIDKLPAYIQETYDVCFHLAWTHTKDEGRNNPFLQEENILATLKAALCAKELGCKVFIGTGSQAEYGVLNRKIDETTGEKPDTLYGIAKLAAGRLALEYCRQNGMRCNWVRIFSVYGPYENDCVFTAYVIRTLLRGEEPALTPCEQIWDYLYSEDAVHALWLVAERSKSSGIYCLGSGVARSIKEYALIIRNNINPNIPLGIGQKPYSKNQVMHLEADISKLKADTGFTPRFSFEEGIVKTIAWYRGEN